MALIFSLSFITLLLVFQQQSCTGEPLIIDAIGIISGVMGIIDFVWDKTNKIIEEDDRQTEIQQFNNYNIEHQIIQMSNSIINVYNQSTDESNNKQTLKQLLYKLSYEVSIIEKWYKEMLHYNETYYSYDNHEREIVIRKAKAQILNRENGLHKIYALFLNGEQHILKLLDSLKKGFKNTCSSDNSLQSVQQIYLKLYSLVTLAGAKTYLTILMAVELIRNLNEVQSLVEFSYQEVVKDTKKNIISQQNKIGRKFKDSLKVSSREVWRCDPDIHFQDETFIEIKNVTYDNKHYDVFYCGCKDKFEICRFDKGININYFVMKINKNAKENYTTICQLNLPQCEGNLCEVKTSQDVNLCLTTVDNFRHDKIRHERNTYAMMNYYGHYKTCTGLDHKQLDIILQDCELCNCTCDEHWSSSEYITLKPVFSNIHKNRVVTGAKLVRENRQIRIVIQEGTLGPMATIVNGSVSWVFNDAPKLSNLFLDANSRDFYRMEWNGRTQFTLTDIEADEGSIVVGLQFGTRPKNPEDGITVILHTRTFDFETGKLFQEETAKQFYASEDLYIEDLDIPILAPGKSVALTETNKRIRLTTTGMKPDFGQKVVPFFDIQEVTTTISTPMSGVGLYYKRYEDYGGFLGLKLFTYDFLKHFNSKISKEVDLNEE